MTSGAKFALVSAVALVVVAGGMVGRQYYLNHHEEVAPAASQYEEPKLADDDMVLAALHKERPDSLKDEQKLIGKPLWISAGGQMDYYKYANHHVDYAHFVDTMPGATEILVKDVFEQKAPSSGRPVMRIAAGEKHVLLAFTMPKSADPNAEYAMPVGNYEAGNFTFFTDEIFFYDDPHVLYKHWSPEMWAHIDKHEPAIGMTENQAMMALGQVITPHGDKPGDRSVTFDDDQHPVTLTFEHGKATRITPGT